MMVIMVSVGTHSCGRRRCYDDSYRDSQHHHHCHHHGYHRRPLAMHVCLTHLLRNLHQLQTDMLSRNIACRQLRNCQTKLRCGVTTNPGGSGRIRPPGLVRDWAEGLAGGLGWLAGWMVDGWVDKRGWMDGWWMDGLDGRLQWEDWNTHAHTPTRPPARPPARPPSRPARASPPARLPAHTHARSVIRNGLRKNGPKGR